MTKAEKTAISPTREQDFPEWYQQDRKSTRLNSSHLVISYAVFCLKKKTAAFEVVDPQLVQPPRDFQLVVDRERQALALRTVAQRRAVQEHVHSPFVCFYQIRKTARPLELSRGRAASSES